MKIESLGYCNYNFVWAIPEKFIKNDGETFITLSITNGNGLELMIFLGRNNINTYYEVRVYKDSIRDKYVPNIYDNVVSYDENEYYATFLFNQYKDAQMFVLQLFFLHPEYIIRPFRKIGS